MYAGYETARYHLGWYIDFDPNKPLLVMSATEDGGLLVSQDGRLEPIEIRGVNLGAGIPGHFATDFAIDKETYLRWFRLIQHMNANVIRIERVYGSTFYDAFYEYNLDNPDPLYLVQGIAVDDYVQNSRRDAYDSLFLGQLLTDAEITVDIIHGQRKVYLGRGIGSGSYNKDISQWVLAYQIGTDWIDGTVGFTDDMQASQAQYKGKYLSTALEATAFEGMLARVGDRLIEYETQKFKQQRLVSFVGSPMTDPFHYPSDMRTHFKKFAILDFEHITPTEDFHAGLYASYNAFTFFYDEDPPIWINLLGEVVEVKLSIHDSYYSYIRALNEHHDMPVVVTDFGYSTARGISSNAVNMTSSQGGLTEAEQGERIIETYGDIMRAGSAGAFINGWQDEWHKKSWNMMSRVDLTRLPYWSDIQMTEQHYGILAFDPGNYRSISYPDGDISEWNEADIVARDGATKLSMKADGRYLYLMVENPQDDTVYVPLDTTPKSGSTRAEIAELGLKAPAAAFEREADFLLVLAGDEDSRLLVQERYDPLRALDGFEALGINAYVDPPAVNSPVFTPIRSMLQPIHYRGREQYPAELRESGLLTHGIGNPFHPGYNNQADFCRTDNAIEVRLPWQLLNFSDRADGNIHDDYYLCYGVENFKISEVWAGVASAGSSGEIVMVEVAPDPQLATATDIATPTDLIITPGSASQIGMNSFTLDSWETGMEYHERLKQSYGIVQDYWEEVIAHDRAG